MVHALQLILLAGLLALAAPVAVFAIQVLLAATRREPPPARPNRRPPVAVLIPAHDEEAGIADTIAAIRPQLREGDRLLVVADNCSDGTAARAREAGAEVTERSDPVRRGKGYALDHGMRLLAQDPPEVVVIVDADCMLDERALDTLACRVQQAWRPVQALYLMQAPEPGRLRSRIAEFAWLVKNKVRPLGYHRAGLPCQLMGTGMAFPWRLLAGADIANGHLVEDMKLGVELAAIGAPPLFCPQARVWSHFPSSEGEGAQRARWEHGHLGMILGEAPRLLLRAVRRRNMPLLALALDLAVPPLALLAMLTAVAFMLAALFGMFTGAWAAFWTALVVLGVLVAAVVQAWWYFGRQVVSAGDLLLAVWYALCKIPLYLRFLRKRQVEWVRTERKT